MKLSRIIPAIAVFVLADSCAGQVRAGWDNVFQICCHSQRRPVVSNYAPNACCPQPVCATQYVQRSYYQPVTSYQTRMYYEPVTTQRTSYYYEPVASYRTSSYYDPCTCSYQQVAVPTTSYQLRAQSCPVQSWVARCVQVPVQTYQQSYYWEPVTTCTSTTVGAPIHALPGTPAPAMAAPPMGRTPGVSEQRFPATPGVSEQPGRGNGGSNTDRYYAPQPMTPGSGSSLRPRAPLTPPPTVRLDKIVAVPQGERLSPMWAEPSGVEGVVQRKDASPQVGARLLFVSTARQGLRQTTTTDRVGQFRVNLGSGEWLVYLHSAEGIPVFHSKLDVRENEGRKVTLMSR